MLPWHYSFRACSYSKHEEDGTEAGSFGHWSTNSPNEGPLLGGFLWKPQRNTILWQVVENPSTFQKGFSFSPQTCELWQAWPATGCWWSWGLTSLCSLCHTPRLGLCICPTKKREKKHLVYWKVVHVKTASDSVWRNAFSVFQVRSIYLDLLSRPPVLAKEKDVTNFPSRDALWSAKGEKSSIASVCAWNAGQQHLENCEDYKVQWKLYPHLDIIGYLMLCFFFPWKCAAGFPLAHPWSLLCLWCVCWRRQTWQSLKNIQSQSSGASKFTLTLSDPSVSKLLAWWFWCHEIVDFV